MVVKILVVSVLTHHIGFCVSEIPLTLGKFLMEQFQLTPGPFHAVPTSVDFDFPGFRQREPRLAESKRLCERDNLSLPPVYADTLFFKPPHDFMSHFLCFLYRGKSSNVIVHKMGRILNPRLTLDPVVNLAGQRYHFLL